MSPLTAEERQALIKQLRKQELGKLKLLLGFYAVWFVSLFLCGSVKGQPIVTKADGQFAMLVVLLLCAAFMIFYACFSLLPLNKRIRELEKEEEKS